MNDDFEPLLIGEVEDIEIELIVFCLEKRTGLSTHITGNKNGISIKESILHSNTTAGSPPALF